ncbi:MAG: hypothetical protein K2M17_02595 [Bacilli bacterium]|nr:hypothetical protein [Bacilli bacterium]
MNKLNQAISVALGLAITLIMNGCRYGESVPQNNDDSVSGNEIKVNVVEDSATDKQRAEKTRDFSDYNVILKKV